MKIPCSKNVILVALILLVACKAQPTQPALTPTVPVPTATPDSGIITPENVDRLVQVKQLGMGLVCGAPHFSLDGKWVYQATTTGVFVFDTKTYEGRRLISSTIAYGCPVDVSPDTKSLAIGENLFATENGEKLPDMDTSLEFQKWAGIREVNFSPDGSLLARTYYANTQNGTQYHIGIWRLTDGKLINIFDVNPYCFPFDLSIDGNLLIIQSHEKSDPKLDLYDIQTGVKLKNWAGVRSVFLPKNQIAIEEDGIVRIIDLETGKQIHAFTGKFPVISPDGNLIVLLDGNQFKVFSVPEKRQLVTLEGVFDEVDQAKFSFSDDGKTLAGEVTNFFTDSASGDFVLWSLPGGASIKKISTMFPGRFSFSPDGKSIARTYGQIRFFDVSSGSLLGETIESNSGVTGVAFLPNNRQLVVVTSNGERYLGNFIGDYQAPLYFYEVDSEKLYKKQPATIMNSPLAFSADGKVYEPDRLRDIPSIKGEMSENIAFSPDGKKIAISYIPSDLAIWDLSKKTKLFYLTDACLYGKISNLSFSLDGNRVAIACIGGSHYEGINNIRIWSATPDAQLLMDIDTTMSASIVSFSPDGRFLASSDKDGVEVRDASSGKLLFSINEPMLGYLYYGAAGARIDFSPDERILAVGLLDSTVELWNTETGQKIYSVRVIDSPYSPVYDLDFSPDGRLLVAGFEDGAVRIYGIK